MHAIILALRQAHRIRSWPAAPSTRVGRRPPAAYMAASKGARKSLVSRTLERCRSGLNSGGRSSAAVAPGCFSVYVGPERERFVVRADRANHPLFRRLLDDAEQEYGYAAQGPLALPCSVDAFLDVLWHMDHDVHDDDEDGEAAVAPWTPICGLQRGGSGNIKVRPAGYRVLSPPKSTPPSFFFSQTAAGGRR
ncbi:hypothetical protein ZWY2020_027425 [Hordeum vulgare]|nr:hypothetical protein ZWY2020_027425 [Hordeum vulgare]